MTRSLFAYNQAAERIGMRGKYRAAVVSIHGIRTTGRWQKEISPHLQDLAIRHESVDYGWTWFLRVMRPFSRRCAREAWKQVEDKYHEQARVTPNVTIIAHSFGSYCIGTMMEAMPAMKWPKIILCGSILRRDFGWDELLKREQITEVRNEVCKRDLPVLFAPLGISGAGHSGRSGFKTSCDAVIQHTHPGSGHSDLLTKSHFIEFWIPFILGATWDALEAEA